MSWAAGALVAVLALGLLGASSPVVDRPVRILLVGDSVTQGSAGDWTWRYRLYRHLQGDDVRVDLVGPDDDLLDNVTAQRGSHAYADPAFDQDHAARWGMEFLEQDHPIGELVDEFHPDVVVEELGVNDLAGDHLPPNAVVDAARRFVRDARAADSTVTIVLMQLPQTWLPGVPEYNADLAAVARELSTSDSPVVTAVPGEPLVEGTDTYDAAHPTASGEVKIAAGVADTLAALGVGTAYPRPLPRVPNGPRTPATLSVEPGDGEADLSWRPPPGATGELVWLRDLTLDQPWTRLPFPVPGTAWTAGGLTNGHDYEFRLQAQKGSVPAQDLYSNVVAVTPTAVSPAP